MNLQTKRLLLRAPRERDAQSYTQIHNSDFVLRFNAMAPTTAEKAAEKFANPECGKHTVFIEEKQTGTLVGAIFLEEDDLRYQVASKCLSYFLREDYSHRGYMKEALQALIAHLFAAEKLECLSARVFAPNTASRALLRSLGFRENGIIPHCVKGYNGVIYDDVIHTLLREDFQ